MVINENSLDLIVKVTSVVFSLCCKIIIKSGHNVNVVVCLPLSFLTAEVVHSVMSKVFLVKKLSHISNGVAIEGFTSTRRKGHGNDSIRHISQVQIKIVVNVATFVL